MFFPLPSCQLPSLLTDLLESPDLQLLVPLPPPIAGLLDADARPPIETPPGYCDAVAGGVNAYTDGMMENGSRKNTHRLL